MIRIVVALVPVLVAGPAVLDAQGVSVSPSFGISQIYDDNLFYRPVAEGDTITRVSARVDAAYHSELETVSARYALDADRFGHHPELTTAHARQDAGIQAQSHVTRRL